MGSAFGRVSGTRGDAADVSSTGSSPTLQHNSHLEFPPEASLADFSAKAGGLRFCKDSL